MLLLVSATEKEIKPLKGYLASSEHLDHLVTGMGPVVTAASLSSYLALQGSDIDGVINIGVGGAYIGSGLELLDICLARQESFGDFGICLQDGIQDFGPELTALNTPHIFSGSMMENCKIILDSKGIAYKEAGFVTVNCCSGSESRGVYLQEKFKAGCENMEGAAIAMVCNNFTVPCIEIRCISNLVENRNPENWKLAQAIEKICNVARIILDNLSENKRILK